MSTDTLHKAVSLLKSAENSKEESGGGNLHVSILRKRLFSDVSLLSSTLKISADSGGSGISRTLGQAIEDGVSEGISKYLKGKEENRLRIVPRRTQKQVHAERKEKKVSGEKSKICYKLALKEATKTYKEKKSQGVSLNDVCKEVNDRYTLERRKISKQTLSNYMKRGKINESPLKRGPPAKIPTCLLEMVDAHVSMMQVAGTEHTRPRLIRALISAAIMNTNWADCASVKYIFEKLKRNYPETIEPSKTNEVDDHRANWTTYPNIKEWLDGMKKIIVNTGLGVDCPMKLKDIFEGRTPPFEIDGE